MNLKKTRQEMERYFKKEIDKINQESHGFNYKMGVVEKYLENKPKSLNELKQLYSILCFGSIGFCCGLSKPCVWRDFVRTILGINSTTYKKTKEKFGYQFWRKSKK